MTVAYLCYKLNKYDKYFYVIVADKEGRRLIYVFFAHIRKPLIFKS